MDSSDVARRHGRIVVDGPLAPFADGLRTDLAGKEFASDTVVDHVHRMADLSGWLSAGGLTTVELTSEIVQEFLLRVGRLVSGSGSAIGRWSPTSTGAGPESHRDV